jgi:hypothetical protein
MVMLRLISNHKLKTTLNKVYKQEIVDTNTINRFKRWVYKHSEELHKDEKSGELFDKWLIDIAKYFFEIKQPTQLS